MYEPGEDDQEAAYDELVDSIRDQLRDEALEDEELYKRVVEDFAAGRLRAFYEGNPDVLLPPNSLLDEARLLVPGSPRAGLVFSVSASEVCLSDALIRPIVHGLIHSEATADVIAGVAVGPGSERFTKSLLRVLAAHGGVDMTTYPGINGKPLWENMQDARKRRNAVLHRGAQATRDEAEEAILIASRLLSEIVPIVIGTIGLHMHADHQVCGLPGCPKGEARGTPSV